MRTSAARIRSRLSYANVLATLTLFVVLAGGSALAGGTLGKNSVGAKQLKAKAVTTAKLKKNAVSTAKIKRNAISEAKVKASSLKGADLAAGLPFGHVVFSAQAGGGVAVGPEPTSVPLDNATFVQEAGTAYLFLGAVDFSAAPGCVNPSLTAFLVADAPAVVPTLQGYLQYTLALGSVDADGATGPLSGRLELSPAEVGPGLTGSPAAQTHSLALHVIGGCEAGSGITVTSAGIDAIGNR